MWILLKYKWPKYNYILWDLYLHSVHFGDCFLPSCVCSVQRSSCKTPAAPKWNNPWHTSHYSNHSGPWRAVQFRHICICTLARPGHTPRWFKVTLCWAHPVLLSSCEISYHQVDLISIKWTLFHFQKPASPPGLWVKTRLVTAAGTAQEFLKSNQFLRRGLL